MFIKFTDLRGNMYCFDSAHIREIVKPVNSAYTQIIKTDGNIILTLETFTQLTDVLCSTIDAFLEERNTDE